MTEKNKSDQFHKSYSTWIFHGYRLVIIIIILEVASNIMHLDLGKWICMVLEWTPEEASLLRIDFSLLQRQSTLGTLGPRDRRLCMRLVLVSFTLICSCIIIPLYETLHDQPFSVTSEESPRDSEPPDIFLYWVPKHQGTGDFMRSEYMKLVLVSFTLNLHTLSAVCAYVTLMFACLMFTCALVL